MPQRHVRPRQDVAVTPPANLLTDVAGLRVGNAEDVRLKSGVTVVLCDEPSVASVHIMGGAPGSRETDLLSPEHTVERVDAIVLSGGSAFGLDAGGGVMADLAVAGRGFAVGTARVPIVPAAILFDLLNGGDKTWGSDVPYSRLGRSALAAAAERFALGSVGAGTGATTANVKGGLGSASARLPTESPSRQLSPSTRSARRRSAIPPTSGPRHSKSAPNSAAWGCRRPFRRMPARSATRRRLARPRTRPSPWSQPMHA